MPPAAGVLCILCRNNAAEPRAARRRGGDPCTELTMKHTLHRSVVALLVSAGLAGAVVALAAPPTSAPATSTDDLVGYGPKAAAQQRAVEQDVIAKVDAAQIRVDARTLARAPHIAGTPAQAETRDYVVAQMKTAGLETETAAYDVYLPFPTEVVVEQVAPTAKRFELAEPPLAQDEYSSAPVPVQMNGFSGSGDVTAPLVYVNYGRRQDLDALAAQGVDLNGKIALVRYGRMYRGLKVENVQARGAVGCILFSDPGDDGGAAGEVYPDGPMRPTCGLQHGSVKCGPPGDPTTPGYASLPDAPRIDPNDSPDIVKIPAVPVAAKVAAELLGNLAGDEAPEDWQGGLGATYHVGPGPTAVRLVVRTDDQRREIWDTLGVLRGAKYPEQCVIIGAHRDAWCCGAADNVSGVASVLAAARACATLAANGHRPDRTLIFATWDAEEWGIVGSTEWVEQNRDRLQRECVAYLNLDMVAFGERFGGSASPTLQALLRSAAKVVPAPDDADKSLFAFWSGEDQHEPRLGSAGGGSDHVGFFLHLGLPTCGYGFGGRQGIYHSLYDTPMWMERFGDRGYRRHAGVAQLTSVVALRLANAPILPYDFVAYSEAMAHAVDDLEKAQPAEESAHEASTHRAAAFRTLRGAVKDFAAAAERFDQARAAATAREVGDAAQLSAINALLQQVTPTLVRPLDAPALTERDRRPAPGGKPLAFERNLVFGVNPDSGYGARTLPGLSAALHAGDEAAWNAEVYLFARQVLAARDKLIGATERLRQAAKQ